MQKPIVIFDSGIGGLSIYQEVKKKLPGLPIVYCSDNEGFPYGPRPEDEVVDRTLHCLEKLANQYQPSLAIIACNTASTISLPRARNLLDIPVVGVVPAIKPAGVASKNGCIGLLATPGTVKRKYTDQLVRDFANHCEVVRVGSSELVQLSEDHLRGKAVSLKAIKDIISPFFSGKQQPDCIVLGCTHFPLVKELLEEASPLPVRWVDSGEAIARRVDSLLERKDIEDRGKSDIFVYSGDQNTVEGLEPALKKLGFKEVREL
ncbi:glutamate racemase [Endozoicomonas sp. OPT23]|uniref:glutamate racemase n=1 Tax=Endozoicomonas sp. OPT23 TaxID=2072845 RepID=UPI00129A676A|nr:glutamate racemase [Endozoicomonas sp. OPT23]MRI33282.1 glutamate racemase [Endozoicomonas sp. OPT23]